MSGKRLGRVGVALVGTLLAVALFAPLIAPYSPNERVGPPFARPSEAHLLGTNDVGHDLLSGLIHGARISLLVGMVAAAAATILGTAVGVAAGYRRGWVDGLLMRAVDVVLCLPFVPLMIVVGVFLGPGLATEIVVIAGVMWAPTARELRSQVLSVRELDHVLAARTMGASGMRVLVRHVLPEVGPLVAPQFVLAAKVAILLEASLSFLGLGDAGAQSWGTMLSFAQARSAFLTDAWLWWVVPPGLAIASTVVGFALIGYGFEERAQPQLRLRRRGVATAPSVARAAPDRPVADDAILSVEGLTVAYGTGAEAVRAVEDATLTVGRGEIVGLVGESGCGKSTLVAASTAMLRGTATVLKGRVLLEGKDLASLPDAALRRLRGKRVAVVPQHAMSALNPVLRIGAQLAEAVRAHRSIGRDEALRCAGELLDMVGVGADRARDYPHELSGGMRQRVVVAMAMANEPVLIVADEPTTGLDLVVAAEITAMLADLRERSGVSMLVVSHDLPLLLRLADRVAVMCDSRIVEKYPASLLAEEAAHPYTRALLVAAPRLPAPAATPIAPTGAETQTAGGPARQALLAMPELTL